MKRAVYLETFGCQMNELDSELIGGALRTLGYTFTDQPAEASVVLYNTCSVREHAEQKVWSRLGEMAVRKSREPDLVVGVLGCMAEREGEKLMRRMPVVDIMVGPGELDKLPGLLDNAIRTRLSLLDDPRTQRLASTPWPDRPKTADLLSAGQVALQGNANRRSATLAAAQDTLELLDLSRAIDPGALGGKSAAGKSAYVRITRGCNKFCTYCVVPFTRGAEVHRPPEHIVDECKRLADAGMTEVTLLGQTVNHYRFEHGASVSIGGITQPQKGRAYGVGGDASGDPHRGEHVTTFADLLAMIHERVPGILRLRFVTSFPRSFGNDILQVMRDSPRMCRYIHVPAQTGSDRLLKLMNRQYTVSEYLEFLDRARAMLHQPEIGRPLTIAGDMIVGFPTETPEDHQASMDLLSRARYKNCYIFKYSPRPGTIAIDKYADDVPDAVKRARNNELLLHQNTISEQVGGEFVGQTMSVFVTGMSKLAVRRARPAAAAAASATTGRVSLTISGKPTSSEHSPHTHEHASPDNDDGCSISGSSVMTEQGPRSTLETASATTPASGPVQMAARTEGDVIAFFEMPNRTKAELLIGQIVRLRMTGNQPLALLGELADAVPGQANVQVS